MKILIGVLAFLLLFSCSRPQSDGALDDTADLAAYLDGNERVMYVRPDQRDAVLNKLQAKAAGDSLFHATVGGETVTFKLITTDMPYLYTNEMFEIPVLALRWKIYFNARCGQKHPGFVSPCIATFGPHKAFGQSMTWTVNDWYSCMRGDSLCIEKYQPVGTITYYPDLNCQDTTFVIRNIMRFRCR